MDETTDLVADGPGLPGLRDAVAHALGVTAPELGAVRVRPVDHRVDNLTTASLHHVEVDVGETTVRLFAKVLQPADRSPALASVPAEHRAGVMAHLRWLDEPDAYRSGVARDLPPGLRMPVVHAIVVDDDRAVLWLEEVEVRGSWDLERYRWAAGLLGRASARWPEARLASEAGLGRRSYDYLFHGKLLHADVPVLRAPGHWDQPDLAALGGARLGERTERLVAAGPRLLEALRALPHALAHGDATPHNLLPTATGELVAVDWSYACADALGADLGQLLAGRFDAGEADPADAPVVAEAILAGYLDGLRLEGIDAPEASVASGFALALAFRSAISATVLDHRPDLGGDERAALLARRTAVATVGLDLLEGHGLL